MWTYQRLWHTPQFVPLVSAAAAQTTAQQLSGLALGSALFARTGSPLLATLAMCGPSLAQLLGMATLLSAADRVPPRAALTGLGCLFALGTAVQALPGLPVWAVFAVLAVLGTCGAVGGGVRYGLLNEVLPAGGYLLGRSVFALVDGAMQVLGFAAGGLVLALLSPRGALLVGAGLYAGAAVVARCGLSRRRARARGRPSPRATWRGNRRLWGSRTRRPILLALWVPNGLVVGCESLYVPYAPRYAGLLFAAGAWGMLLGDLVVARLLPERHRARLVVPLCLLLALPHLVVAARPPVPFVVAAAFVAGVGYASGLPLQERLLSCTPSATRGQALALHSAGMLATQGLCAALAGGLAEWTSPAAALGMLAVASVAVTLLLAPRLGVRSAVPAADVARAPCGGRGRQGPPTDDGVSTRA